jgi:hypothetical protein
LNGLVSAYGRQQADGHAPTLTSVTAVEQASCEAR